MNPDLASPEAKLSTAVVESLLLGTLSGSGLCLDDLLQGRQDHLLCMGEVREVAQLPTFLGSSSQDWRGAGPKDGRASAQLGTHFEEGFLEEALAKLGFEGWVGVCQMQSQVTWCLE